MNIAVTGSDPISVDPISPLPRHEKWGREARGMFTLLDVCLSSLRRGHANLLRVAPMVPDDPRRESEKQARGTFLYFLLFLSFSYVRCISLSCVSMFGWFDLCAIVAYACLCILESRLAECAWQWVTHTGLAGSGMPARRPPTA